MPLLGYRASRADPEHNSRRLQRLWRKLGASRSWLIPLANLRWNEDGVGGIFQSPKEKVIAVSAVPAAATLPARRLPTRLGPARRAGRAVERRREFR